MRQISGAVWRRRYGLAAGLLLAAILVLAAALRLKGISWGLLYSFLNADENVVIPKGFAAARGHLNPQFFLYPSFFFYLLAGVYLLAAPVLALLQHATPFNAGALVVDPGPYYLLARLVSAAFGVASVWIVYRIGRGAFGRAVGLLAALSLAVVPLHVTYSHMAVTDVTATAFTLLALLLLCGAAQRSDARLLLAGAIVAGLATSTKYNMGMLVLPATIAAFFVLRGEAAQCALEGAHRLRVWARLLARRVWGPMVLAFVAGSPFTVLDPIHFVGDFIRQSRIMERGWLGFEHVESGFWYNLTVNLRGSIGLFLVVLCFVGLAWAVWRRTRFDLIVAPYVITYLLYIGTWKELMDRYLLPVIPLLLLFAVRFCVEVADRYGRPHLPSGYGRAVVVAVLCAALAVPAVASLSYVQSLSGVEVRVRAKEWVERTIPSGSTVAMECACYGPPLALEKNAPFYRAAGLDPRVYRVLEVELPAPATPNPSHSFAWLRKRGAEYVVISAAVRDRVMAAADSYPEIVAFYEELEARAAWKVRFRPGPGERGYELTIYRLPALSASR